VKTEKNTGMIAFHFRQVLLYFVHEVKVKITLEQATKVQRGGENVWLYSFINLGAR